MSDTNPYENACDAYEKHMASKGWSDDDCPDAGADFHVDHTEAIGAAVEAAVKAERERVLAEFKKALQGTIGDVQAVYDRLSEE